MAPQMPPITRRISSTPCHPTRPLRFSGYLFHLRMDQVYMHRIQHLHRIIRRRIMGLQTTLLHTRHHPTQPLPLCMLHIHFRTHLKLMLSHIQRDCIRLASPRHLPFLHTLAHHSLPLPRTMCNLAYNQVVHMLQCLLRAAFPSPLTPTLPCNPPCPTPWALRLLSCKHLCLHR